MTCQTCKKSPPAVVLKKCAKCSTTPYCSRDCQKADWKSHKKVCGQQSGARSDQPAFGPSRSMGSSLSPPKGLERPIAKPFTRIDDRTWLHDRPEEDVYRLLIDVYRMRMEDDYKIEQRPEKDSIYAGAADGLAGFRRFLDKTAKQPKLLPAWWSAEKQKACEELGMNDAEWNDLRCSIEKSDIIDHYGDPQFPMQLRMFGEFAFGTAPGGQPGAPVRQMLMRLEQGTADEGTMGSVIDGTTMNVSQVHM